MIQAQLLKPYENHLSKPQQNHFSSFIQSLQLCEKSSVNRFSKLNQKSRSSMARFLTESPWEIEILEKEHIKQITPYIQKESYLLIDDTISHRPFAKKVECANLHFDHTINGYSLGYSIVTSTVLTKKSQIPFQIKPYYRKENCTDFEFITKNEIKKFIIIVAPTP